MSGGNGTDSSTQVLIVRCMWVPVALSCHARYSMPLSLEDPTVLALPDTECPRAWLLGAWVHSE
jgi:hypothetical protein